jgi:small-conductance mechanosensitive channel
LKTNIQPFPRLLDKLVQLEPVHFDWSASVPPELHRHGANQTGFVAQQVEKIFPEMVTMGKDGYRRVNYGLLPYLLLQGVRELKESNDNLHADTQRLRQQNEKARAEIAKLRKAAAATEARFARLDRASAAKDAQIAVMSRQIEQLRQAQERMAVLLARVASPESGQGKQAAEVRPTVKQRGAQEREVARAQF